MATWDRELSYIYRAFFHYRKPWAYFYGRFAVGPGILELPAPISNGIINNIYSIHILSGHRDMLMLLWSLASWYHVVGESGRVYIHDDGTFTAADKQILGRLLPHDVIVDYQGMSRRVLARLTDRFPSAHHYRSLSLTDHRYIFNLKLIDPFFVGEAGLKLILDSDLLWFEKPEELHLALLKKHLPVFMGGFGKMDFKFWDGSELSENIAGVNSGVVGYQKKQFSLDVLEEFYSRIDSRANPHFVEQAGYAYILTRQSQPNFLSAEEYQIKGPVNPQTVMKHYTNPRREQFWFEGVKILGDEISRKLEGVSFGEQFFKQIIRYFISGITSVAANVSVFYALTNFLAVAYPWAAAAALVVSFFTSFFLQKFWTFQDDRRDVLLRQLLLFFGAFLVDLAINVGVLFILIEKYSVPEILAQIVALGLIAGVNFVLFRFFVFRQA